MGSTAWEELSQRVLTTAQVRAVDQQAVQDYGMHSLVLMENAALGCRRVRAEFSHEPGIVSLLARFNGEADDVRRCA